MLKITLINVMMQPNDFLFSFEKNQKDWALKPSTLNNFCCSSMTPFNCSRSFWKYGHRHVFELYTEQPGAAVWSRDSFWFFSLLAINSFSGRVWWSGERENSLFYMSNYVCSGGKQPSREQCEARKVERERWVVQLEALQLCQGLSLPCTAGGLVSALLKA